MKKLILAIIVLFALLTPAFAATAKNCTTTDDLVDNQLDVKYDFAFYRIEVHRVGMDSIIDTLKLEAANTSKLEDLNEKFLEKSSELKDADTIYDFNEITHEL